MDATRPKTCLFEHFQVRDPTTLHLIPTAPLLFFLPAQVVGSLLGRPASFLGPALLLLTLPTLVVLVGLSGLLFGQPGRLFCIPLVLLGLLIINTSGWCMVTTYLRIAYDGRRPSHRSAGTCMTEVKAGRVAS